MHIQRGERSEDERKRKIELQNGHEEKVMRGRWNKIIKILQRDREQEKREDAVEIICVFFIPLKLTHIYITFRQKQRQATKTDRGKEENKKDPDKKQEKSQDMR